jgi:hypothetical protein
VPEWDREVECGAGCFWAEASGEPLQRWQLYLLVATGEKIDKDRARWQVDWSLVDLLLRTEHPLTVGAEPCEIVDTLASIMRQMNAIESDSMLLLQDDDVGES